MKQERLKESYDEIFAKAVKRYSSDSSAQRSKAFTAFRELEKVGHVGCLKYLANCYLEGIGCAQNIDKAREYCMASIALGHYNDSPKPSSYEMIRQIDHEIYGAFDDAEDTFNSDVRDAACTRAMYINYVNSIVYGKNERIAWLRLGDIYHDGIGVEANKTWAVYFYRRAYKYGKVYDEAEGEILFKIGKSFYNGEGVKKDDALAKWFLSIARYGWWRWEESEVVETCEILMSAIGELDENIWIEEGCLDEDDYLDVVSNQWLCSEPDYV